MGLIYGERVNALFKKCNTSGRLSKGNFIDSEIRELRANIISLSMREYVIQGLHIDKVYDNEYVDLDGLYTVRCKQVWTKKLVR